jgi:hypothetical protein
MSLFDGDATLFKAKP